MLCRHYSALILAGSALLLSGCVQSTRHSNTMVFGTKTTLALKVGTTTGATPEIVVGYDRQEAVIMPLLANTVDKSKAPNNRLSPCDVSKPLDVTGAEFAVHPCSFVAVKGGSLDSYSVLASFGADFSAKAANSPEASGGLAQYFATGMAAQILAAKGGAALVSTSKSAAENNAAKLEVDDIFPDESSFKVGAGKSFDNKMVELRSRIRETADAGTREKKLVGLFDNLRPASPVRQEVLKECKKTVDACVTVINDKRATLLASDNFEESVGLWTDY